MNNARYLSIEDGAALGRLAERLLRLRDVNMNAGEAILQLLEAAELVPGDRVRGRYAGLGSTVGYREIGSGCVRTVRIASAGNVAYPRWQAAVLDPVVLTLLGRPLGGVAELHCRFNRIQFVEIVAVADDAPAVAGVPDARRIER